MVFKKEREGDGGTFPGMNKKGGRYQVFGGEYLYLLIGKKYNEKKSCVNTF